jgi:hypothetical protein
MTDDRTWSVNIWDLMKVSGVKDRASYMEWTRRTHPDMGGDTNANAIVQSFYNKRKRESDGVLVPPTNYVSSFAGGGMRPPKPPVARATAATAATSAASSNKSHGQDYSHFAGNFFAGSAHAHLFKDIEQTPARAKMQDAARGPCLPGMCERKINNKSGSRTHNKKTWHTTGLKLGERVNCPNKARNGSVHCASHKKFDTMEQVQQVARLKAATDAKRSKAKQDKQDLKNATQKEYDRAYDDAMKT